MDPNNEKRPKKVFLLGAGASEATLGEAHAPTSSKFGKLLVSIPDWSSRWPFLHRALGYLSEQSKLDVSNWALDAAWNGIDENYKLRRILRDPELPWPDTIPKDRRLYAQHPHPVWDSFWILAGWELRRAVAEVYGTRLRMVMACTRLKEKEITKRLEELDPEDTIVTTNYDLLVEAMAQEHWPGARSYVTKADFQARKKADLSHLGPMIIKLHGSLDWVFGTSWLTGSVQKRNYVGSTGDNRSMSDQEIDLHEDGWERRPLLVPPVKYKDEMLMPRNQPDEVVEVLTAQWARFRDVVEKADELRVFGYRFPPEDAYGDRILQDAARKRAPNHPLRLFLHLPKMEAEEVEKRLREQIFFRPDAVHIQPCGPIPP